MNRVEIIDQDTVIYFSGKVNEDSDFSELPKSSEGKLIFDLEEVTLLNSAGLRLWILWMRSLDASIKIVFQRCPRIVVDQMNILNGFVPPNSEVISFYVPYYCEECDNEDENLIENGKDFQQGEEINKNSEGLIRKCAKCNEEMDMDVIPEKYFRFLTK